MRLNMTSACLQQLTTEKSTDWSTERSNSLSDFRFGPTVHDSAQLCQIQQ